MNRDLPTELERSRMRLLATGALMAVLQGQYETAQDLAFDLDDIQRHEVALACSIIMAWCDHG